jgi:imidazolonepropionase-like amidohydrolase
LTVEEMRAAVEEAHKAGRKVTAHAYSPRAIANALDASVDSIEHGSLINGDLAERMAREGKYLVPTLSVYRAMAERGPQLGTADYIVRKTAVVVEASRRALALALEAGVPLATGTDCGSPGHPHGSLAEEVIALVEAGARPAQAIRFATAGGADLLGLADEVGTLTPGKRADLVAVAEDPLRDPRALRSVRLVLKDGRQVWPLNAGLAAVTLGGAR